jgi:hypothetical protein
MAKLTKAKRKKIPADKFGLPKERAYPMPDRAHAANAKARAAQFASPAERSKINAKADKILYGGKKAKKKKGK